MLRYLCFGCLYIIEIVAIDEYSPCCCDIERDALAFVDDLYERLANGVPNRQLVKNVRVSLRQVSHH